MRCSMIALLAVLAAAPAVAVTSISPNAPEQRPDLVQGGVELQAANQLKVDGKTYLLSYGGVRVFDRNGKPLEGAKLAPGMRIAFAVSQDGAASRITSVWIL